MAGWVRSSRCRAVSAIIGLFLIFPGCVQPPESRVAQLDPYVGGRPAPIRPLRRPTPPPTKYTTRGAAWEKAWMPPRGISNRWECIVIHHSASDRSTPQGMRQWHMQGRGWDELGYHFVIGNGIGYGDGQVFVGARWYQQKHGAHCKTPDNFYNQHGIGICLIGDLEAHPPTPRQVESLARLASFLSQQCGIPRSKILTHGGVTGKTACPGRHFSVASVLRRMSVLSASLSPTEDAADGMDHGGLSP